VVQAMLPVMVGAKNITSTRLRTRTVNDITNNATICTGENIPTKLGIKS